MTSAPVLVIDDAIAHGSLALASLATLHPVRAAEIPETVARIQPDGLLVRSVTRVDAALLDAAPSLRFVATATAGTDHLDHAELDARGITHASAAGCNAQAVAEWVLAALTRFEARIEAGREAGTLARGPIGVVGFGNVGTRLVALLRRLGHEVLACDPPRARAGDTEEPLVELAELWERCAIVSFHVPLITSGRDRTLAYLDAHAPAVGTSSSAEPKLVINTSRGPVIRDAALDRPDVGAFVLDVWDGEPELHWGRLRDPKLWLASPHVAGYSLEAKIAATRMMHEAVCAWLGRPPSWTGAELLPGLAVDPGAVTAAAALAGAFDFDDDDARVRALADAELSTRASGFEALRRGYALRREFSAWTVPAGHAEHERLVRAGFRAV